MFPQMPNSPMPGAQQSAADKLPPDVVQALLQLFAQGGAGQAPAPGAGPLQLPTAEGMAAPEAPPPSAQPGPEGVPPAMLDALAAPAGYADEDAGMESAEARAAALRKTPMAEGRQIGSMYIADPGGALLSGAKQAIGHYQGKKLEKKREETGAKRAQDYRVGAFGEF